MNATEQLAMLIDGYETGTETLHGTLYGKSLTLPQLKALASKNGIAVYMPGEYPGRDCVVITDEVLAYAVVNGEVEVIAG